MCTVAHEWRHDAAPPNPASQAPFAKPTATATARPPVRQVGNPDAAKGGQDPSIDRYPRGWKALKGMFSGAPTTRPQQAWWAVSKEPPRELGRCLILTALLREDALTEPLPVFNEPAGCVPSESRNGGSTRSTTQSAGRCRCRQVSGRLLCVSFVFIRRVRAGPQNGGQCVSSHPVVVLKQPGMHELRCSNTPSLDPTETARYCRVSELAQLHCGQRAVVGLPYQKCRYVTQRWWRSRTQYRCLPSPTAFMPVQFTMLFS